ncbi:hypothetical protein [Paenibacillus sp. Leaf72]|uniref:hypothetical protein n=1 Tax=Paenibacillus sp. Leaf72 TaxID=1736234 RepID=UPI0012DCB7FB|nr:hypothetical protein [Paenibacillus sp. Leaf72]
MMWNFMHLFKYEPFEYPTIINKFIQMDMVLILIQLHGGVIPQQWHGLIYEAINIKRLRPDRCYYSNEKRLADLVALLRYIHLEANRIFDDSIDLMNE